MRSVFSKQCFSQRHGRRVLYFAYGSNMHWPQMKERCPSARFVGIAKVPNHRLAFTRKSVKRGCGVADLVADPGHDVWGVIFEIDETDIGQLDDSEGYRTGRQTNSYWRRECTVLVDGRDDQATTTQTYFAEPQPNPPLPDEDYKNLIVSGAKRWGLPAVYLAELEKVEVQR